MEATIGYRLITFADVQSAPYSTASVDGAELKDRVVFARTRSGKYAKFQATRVGDNLRVSRLTVYDAHGLIELVAPSFVVRTSYGCDLENGQETASAAIDFFWDGISPGVTRLWASQTGVALGIDFEQLRWVAVRYSTDWSPDRVDGTHLEHQIVYIVSPQRRLWAKALVEVQGNALVFLRLVVWTVHGSKLLDTSNIVLWGRRAALDLRTGNINRFFGLFGSADLAWGGGTLNPLGGTLISYPSYYRFAKYLPLLADSSIRTALQFERPGGSVHPNLGYDYWEEELRRQLDEDLYLLETARPLPQTGPPPTTAVAGQRVIDWRDARNLYLAHVAQSLWVEATQAVPWRLSRSAAELEQLFASEKLMSRHASQYEFGVMGVVTAWNPQAAFEFLRVNGMIGADAFATVKKFADWCRHNLVHVTGYTSDPNGPFATEWEQYLWYYGYDGYPPVERVLQPAPGKPHMTVGCWGTSGLLAGVLRAVNIPVRHGRTNFSGAMHSRPEFISIGQNLAHGDDPYNRLVGVGHHTPPIDVIFYTDADLAAQIDNPPPLPGKTVPETTSRNALRKLGDVAIQYKTDYLLGLRCADNQTGAPPTVTWSRLWQDLHDAYTNAELTQIAALCDTEIAALGGCSQIPQI